MNLLNNKKIQLLLVVLVIAALLVFFKDLNPATLDLNFGLEFVGGVRIPVTLEKSVDTATMSLMVDTIKTRINKFGLSQVLVRPLGDREIIVELPKASQDSIGNVERLLREQGKFEALMDGVQVLNGSYIIPTSIGGAGGEQVNPDGSWQLVFAISGEGEEHFARSARGRVGQNINMYLDRPENAAIVLSKNDVDDYSVFTETALRKALKKEGDDVELYFTDDLEKDSKILLSSSKTTFVIGENTLNSSIYKTLIGTGFSQEVNSSKRIIVRKNEEMRPQIYTPSGAFGGETTVFSWKAIGLTSAPTLQVEPLAQKVITQYTISGSAQQGSSAKETQQNAVTEIRELKSVLSGGRLPVSTLVGSYYNISPSLGSQFLAYSLYAILGAVILVAVVIFLRYKRFELVIPIIFTLSIEILVLMAIIGGLGTLDLGAMAAVIALIGSGVDNQIIITDELLKGRKEEEGEEHASKEKLGKAFEIVMTTAGVAFAAMLPLVFSGIVEVMGFAITTIVGVLLGVLITRPAYAAIVEEILSRKKQVKSE